MYATNLNSLPAFSRQSRSPEHFPDPFCDMSSLAMPDSIRDALLWSEFIVSANGPYREAIRRIISYFITDITISSASGKPVGREERKKYEDFLNDTIGIKDVLADVALDYLCFHGDTKTTTRDGVFTLRELAGKTVEVLSAGGVYRKAEFKSFGRQELLEVEFSDGRKVLATPEHQWIVLDTNKPGESRRVPTTALRGRRIARTVAPRPAKNEDFYEGVRHGFVFGDGCLYNDGKQARAYFYGEKAGDMLRYFDGHGLPAYEEPKYKRHIIHGLPIHYKSLPENDRSDSYWYGFICGFLAADGSVDTWGCAILTQHDRSVLEVIESQLPRVGMVGGPLRTHNNPHPREYAGHTIVSDGDMTYLTLLKRFMTPQDFLREKHRDRFEKKFKATNYGEYIGVRDVRETGIVDEVFCCVEPETHSFVIENGIITGNCYGNSMTSILVPFRRYLCCGNEECGLELPLRQIAKMPKANYQFSGFKFHATCPHCNYSGVWRHVDRRSGESGKIKVKRWNPHFIDIRYDLYSTDREYLWRIPDLYRRQIQRGELFELERANWEIIEAIAKNEHMLLDPDVIYHMHESTLAGHDSGWGYSRTLVNFRQAWYMQVLQRYNEAIALDYIIPFRVITPVVRPGAQGDYNDPALTMNLGDFVSRVNHLLALRRQDPARWNVMSQPIEYKALGGEASQLAPKDLIELALDTLLTSIGVPIELYRGTLTTQAAGPALRLFEANWNHLTHKLNRFLARVVEKLSQLLNWEPVVAKLQRVRVADDINRQMAILQLMMGGQISRSTGLEALQLVFEDEARRKLEEDQVEAEATQDAQEEMEQAADLSSLVGPSPIQQMVQGQQQGQPAQGGAAPATGTGPVVPPVGPMGQPAGPGGAAAAFAAGQGIQPNQPVTLEELDALAETIAAQIATYPDPQKRSALIRLRQSNEALHALVRSKLDQVANDASLKGREIVMQQQYGKAAAVRENPWLAAHNVAYRAPRHVDI